MSRYPPLSEGWQYWQNCPLSARVKPRQCSERMYRTPLLPIRDSRPTSSILFRIAGNITMTAHVQSTRHLVFILVDILLAKQLPALKSLGDEFIASYVKLAEGEKDPRNLMLAFGIARVLLIEMDPYKHLDVSIVSRHRRAFDRSHFPGRTCSTSYTATFRSPSVLPRMTLTTSRL
jgi:hypothetical protein